MIESNIIISTNCRFSKSKKWILEDNNDNNDITIKNNNNILGSIKIQIKK
jgi:hypothetical protein